MVSYNAYIGKSNGFLTLFLIRDRFVRLDMTIDAHNPPDWHGHDADGIPDTLD
jgi:hypothetical protein